ncbi:MAG: prolipoprotein diacylglyceryl transferase [Anaerolineae bacterium]
MWQEIVACSSEVRVAFCLPIRIGGELFPVYWYGIIAAIGIIVGATYAQHHLRMESEDPDIVWDALLFVLPAGLLGARLWYVAQTALAGTVQYSSVLDVFNPRQGGMNIFGGALLGFIALALFTRARKADGWVLADGALMGLLLGQAIGRMGNLVNRELYGPPTELPWCIRIPAQFRLPDYATLPPDTRIHPTMVYEAIWLVLVFGVMYYLFQRYQREIVRGIPAGVYFIAAGIGRFIVEVWRPDQPTIPNPTTGEPLMTAGQFFALLYMLLGTIIVLERTGYIRIPFLDKPPTWKERRQAYDKIEEDRERQQRRMARERERQSRRRERRERREQLASGDTEETQQTS